MNQNKEINELDLFRYMNHELSGQEQTEVEEWINASEENRKIAEDYYQLSFAVTSLQFIKRSAPQKALEKVDKRLKKEQFRKIYLFVQKVAVILLLPLLVLSGYLLLQPEGKAPVFLPGSPHDAGNDRFNHFARRHKSVAQLLLLP